MLRANTCVCVLLLCFVLFSHGNSCDLFNNVKVTLNNEQENDVKNSLDEVQDAYRIRVNNQKVPKLCKYDIQNLVKLDTLEFDSCGIKEIDVSAFDNLPSLRNLVIVHNDFEKVSRGIFGNLLVRKLNLSDNGIEKIEEKAFENMLNLEVIDLNSNKLTNFDGNWFKYTPNLYRIDVMYNEITEIPENAFTGIIKDKIKKHDLELWFMYNSIRNIHKKAFAGVEKIENLWLSKNELSDIDVEVFANVQHIQVLLLDNNKFVCFGDQFLEHLHVKELDIDSNPIDCECLKKVKRWSRKKDVQLQSLRMGLNCLLSKLNAIVKKSEVNYE